MLPPWESGVSELIESISGDVLSVPICGLYGSVTRVLQRTCFSSTWILRVSSGSGSLSVAVSDVPVSAPKCGIMQQVPQGFSPRGSMDSMWTANASPGSAPSIMMGPFCGLTNGIRNFSVGLSCSVRIAPSNASRVSMRIRSPGLTVRTGLEYGPIV